MITHYNAYYKTNLHVYACFEEENMITSKALLFDLDGTLVNSTQSIELIWSDWAAKHKLEVTPILKEMHGTHGSLIINKYAPHLDLETEMRYLLEQELIMAKYCTEIPGAKKMLEALSTTPWGIVTMSSKAVALAKLTAANLPIPAVLVSADDISESKPSPIPYLKGALWLDVEATQCLVFEDAKAGVESALNAGMPVIQIMHSRHSALIDGIHHSITDWSNITLIEDKNYIHVDAIS